MTTNHTQGPWQHVRETYGDIIKTTNGTGVVILHTKDYGRPSMCDGGLIAAATGPAGGVGAMFSDKWLSYPRRAITVLGAHDAIAKARGV